MAEQASKPRLPLRPGRKLSHVGVLVAVAIVYIWAIRGSDTNPYTLVRGLPFMIDYVGRMFPPDLSILGRLTIRAGETLQMAIMGTTFGAALALPLSFLAARNVMPYRPVYQATRTLFDACRGINEIIWALLFVSMVGLGPFPGVLALTVHLTGALGKYYSETIEAADRELVLAISSTGASRVQTVYHGVVPQVRPLFAGYTFYYLEHSFRAATVLGLVGAGGIGIELINSVRLFKNDEVLTTLLVMVVTVTAIDRLSAFVRMRFITGVEA